ncbi:DUF6153 family protein [Blastococcus sp. SYSU DS0539]
MAARRLWVLLVLAGVFSMHGLQCMSADGGPGHGAAHGTASSPVEVAVAASHPGLGAVAAAFATAAHAGPEVAASRSVGLPGLHLPARDAQVWAACLAVLLAVVTVLGALARLRRAAALFVRGPPSRSRRPGGTTTPLRPPELSALCLLRI